jgi:hypothetical protein
MTPIPAPFKPRLTENTENTQVNNSRFRALADWKPEVPAFNYSDTLINWVEQKYPSGQIRSREPLLDGLRHGEASYWHENGRLYGKIIWVLNAKHGIISLYRADGSIEQKLSYKNGRLHGLCRWYSDNGNITNYALYEEGVLIDSGTDLPWPD